MDFEAKLEAFYNQLDLDGTTIIDIGAHIGRHAIPLAKKIGPAGLLYAFEPIPLIRNRRFRPISTLAPPELCSSCSNCIMPRESGATGIWRWRAPNISRT